MEGGLPMKILLLDIESAPLTQYRWSMYQDSFDPASLVSDTYMLCWSAKWADEKEVMSSSVLKGKTSMLNEIRGLLHEADVVVHYYGSKFDIPMLNNEFLREKLTPPSPYKQIDLCTIMKRSFRFASSKLQYISKHLGLGEKVKHEGFELWLKCMAGNKDAFRTMLAYNKQDVILLEKLYKRLLPWIELHPNHGVYSDVDGCPACGSTKFHARGTVATHNARYQRFQCQDCGKWFRGSKPVHNKRPLGTRNVRP